MSRLELSDEDLIRECRSGAEGAWNALIERYGKAVYGTILTTLARYGCERRADLADDVYQQVLIEVFEKNKLAVVREARLLRPFLVTAAATRTIDALRKLGRGRRREIGAEHAGENRPDAAAQPDESARRSEMAALLQREIASLSSKESYMLRLSVEHDLTHAQIGELMDIPRDTVSTSLRRSKEKIRDALRNKGISEI